ncbi:MAG: hypothetical protein CL728_03505 [Chloroflexi bacterium]|nr:hypothetical protein [Chloroflexota bacterium]|tara:strand:- start:1393 stop:4095 length:2703 start_codon:yes stop_codon:yes gene_type:complete
MSYQDNKISQLIEDQLPNFLQEDGPKFVQFVQKYYEWMETSKLEVSVSTGGVISLLTSAKIKATKQINGSDDVKHVYAEVINSYLLDNGNYLFYIKEYNEDPNSPQTRGFSSGEAITIIEGDGGSSGTISVVSYIQNATLSSKNLWNLQDIDRTLDDYVDHFMKEYLEGFPLAFPSELQSTDIDVPEFKKFLVKHSREFYQSKGTVDSFKYFFRSFFNDNVEVSYPKDEVLKPSDNTFSRTKIIFLQPNSLTPPSIESQKIKGQTSGVSAYVETIIGIRKGEYDVFEIELNETGLSGDFLQGENIVLESDPSTIIGTVHYGASNVEVYDVEESFIEEGEFYIDRGGEIVQYSDIPNIDRGSLIQINTCEIHGGQITGMIVTSGGTGYSVGEEFTFDNTDCLVDIGPRRPLKVVISKVNGGVIQEVEVITSGKGYNKLPTVTKIGTTDISNETFQFVSQDVGTIKRVKIRESGIKYIRTKVEGYDEDWTGSGIYASKVLKKTEIGVELPYLTLDIINPSGNFTVGEIVSHQSLDGTGKVVSWNSGTNKLVLREYSGTFSSSGTDIIEGATSNETGTVSVASYDQSKYKIGNGQSIWTSLSYSSGIWSDNILTQPYSINLDLNSSGTDNIKLSFGSIFDDGGRFLNNNSFVSDVKYIQDSFYYQVYSYVLKTSLEVSKYKDLLKRLIHPAGMEMFGKIESISSKQVKMSVSQIKSNISMHFWDYIGKHSETVIRDFDFLYSLLILDGSSSSTSLVIEKVVDGGENSSKQFNLINGINYPIIPEVQFHGSYACDFLTNENTHQNHRFKIKYKNLRPGTLDNNDFYKWSQVTGTVSIPIDSHTVTGYGTTFTSLSSGDVISINGQQFTISSITNDTSLVVNNCSQLAVTQGENIQMIKRVLISV